MTFEADEKAAVNRTRSRRFARFESRPAVAPAFGLRVLQHRFQSAWDQPTLINSLHYNVP